MKIILKNAIHRVWTWTEENVLKTDALEALNYSFIHKGIYTHLTES